MIIYQARDSAIGSDRRGRLVVTLRKHWEGLDPASGGHDIEQWVNHYEPEASPSGATVDGVTPLDIARMERYVRPHLLLGPI